MALTLRTLARRSLNRSTQNFFQASNIRCTWIPGFTIRFYSSSSSSSSSNSTKRITTPATQQKKELSFVHVNQIRPRDLAQITFFALDRPLLSFGNEQMQQSIESTQHQDWEEEDFEEESLASSNTTPLTNPLSLTSSPFYPEQSTISMTPAELLVVVNKFLEDVRLKIKEQETLASTEEAKKKVAIINSQEQLIINIDKESERKTRENTLHLTNIVQKRRLKMNKHKSKKLRKRQRALRKRLGK